MSQIAWSSRAFTIGCALLAVLAVGCSKQNGVAFDPDAGHPADFFSTHPDAYLATVGACTDCHGGDLDGGIAAVSCFSASRNGQSCHADGPGPHPGGWLALHTVDPSIAATCAPCHDNKANNLPPNCFDNSLCHGPKAGHPAGWLAVHWKTSPSLAYTCAPCHDNKANNLPPNCFDNSLCHGPKGNPHPSGWRDSHTHTNPNQAPVCYQCHHKNSGTPNCFNDTLCHGNQD